MVKKYILVFSFFVIIVLLDYYRVSSEFKKSNDIIFVRQSNNNYSWYFNEIYKVNKNQYLEEHSEENFTNQLKKNFKKDLNDKEFDFFLKSQLEQYFEDPFNKKNNFKYYPIYNSQNKIKGYILLSSGIDKHIDNIFDTKIHEADFHKFKLYDKGFNYFDYYFGRKDIVVESVFNKDDK